MFTCDLYNYISIIYVYIPTYFPVAAESPSCFPSSSFRTPILFLTEGASASAGPGAAFQKLIKMVSEDRYGNHPISHTAATASMYRSIQLSACLPTFYVCMYKRFSSLSVCTTTIFLASLIPHLLDWLSLSSLVLFSTCTCTCLLTWSLKIHPTPTFSIPF
jgi:hypothetical protein